MRMLKKIFFLFLVPLFLCNSSLYAHGGDEGGEDWLAAMIFHPKNEFGGFQLQPIDQLSQSRISGDTIDLDDITPLSLEQLSHMHMEDLKNNAQWAALESSIWSFIAGGARVGEIGSKGIVITAAIATAVLAASPEVLAGLGGLFAEAEALTPAQQLAWGITYAGATSGAENLTRTVTDNKSPNNASINTARAMLQSAILGSAIPNNPAIANILDTALSEVDTNSPSPTYSNGLTDYGPGYTTTTSGQTLMR